MCNFISGKHARHALRQGEQGFLAWVSAVEETKASYSDFPEIIDSSSKSSHNERKELLTVLRVFRMFSHQTFPRSYHRNVRSTIILISFLDHLLRLDLLIGCLSPYWTNFRFKERVFLDKGFSFIPIFQSCLMIDELVVKPTVTMKIVSVSVLPCA